MSKRHWKLRIQDVITCATRIQDYLNGMNYEQFAIDQKTIDAVIRNLEIIGEASKSIPEEIMQEDNNINWEGIIALRNVLAHMYFDVDLKIIWRITQDNIPDLIIQMESLLLL
jgi:uncharacterized protein with HEPN domain